MLFGARESSVIIDGEVMNYVEMGRGKIPLIVLPGLSDGLKTVRGQALSLAFYFREYLKDFRVYVFSRREEFPSGCTTRDMATDLKAALDQLGIDKVYMMGVSQGGMVAQWFAADYPYMVEKLVLAVSAAKANRILTGMVSRWVAYARNNDYKSLIIDTFENSYSPRKLKTGRLLYPILGRIGKPRDFRRFLDQAHAVLTHNAYDQLGQITCPVLIIGGDSDKVVGTEAARELADKISGSHLLIYQGLGHGTYEEARDFNRQVKDFLL